MKERQVWRNTLIATSFSILINVIIYYLSLNQSILDIALYIEFSLFAFSFAIFWPLSYMEVEAPKNKKIYSSFVPFWWFSVSLMISPINIGYMGYFLSGMHLLVPLIFFGALVWQQRTVEKKREKTGTQ